MIPQRKSPPPQKMKQPTDAEMEAWKKKNPRQLHPYWIERYRHYHLGEKHVAKAL